MQQFIQNFAAYIDADGRIRTSFQMTVTDTGRLSSREPNLQNIPIRKEEGAEIRKMFVAAPGKVLVDADYSQIELRVLAHIASDEAMQRKTLDFDIHLIGSFEVLDSHTIAYYQDEKKGYAKNANSIGLSVRDLYELETLRVGEYETLPSTYSFYRIGPASMRCITDGGAELTFVRE